MSIDDKLAELGITLPEPQSLPFSFVPTVQTGNQLWISGQVPKKGADITCKGKLGRDVSVQQGQEAAQLCALNALSQAKKALGSLDRVAKIIKVTITISSTIWQSARAQRSSVRVVLETAYDDRFGFGEIVLEICVVKGFVASAEGFGDQPLVINGASDVLVKIFGENGRHARSAIGVAELPFGSAVEVEMILEVKP